MMKRRDRHLIGSVVLLLVVVTGFFGIMAYNVHQKQLNNTFTIGYNEIRVIEDFEPPEKLQPGIEIKKAVYIENTGPVDCYVRVLAEYTNSTMDKYTTVDINTKDWIKEGAYYYYKEPLVPGARTASLFSVITVNENAPVSDLTPFDILIYAESKNYTIKNGIKW